MLRQLSKLSIWEISHHWHGENPDKTSPKSLPLDVQNTLRALAGSSSKALYFCCSPQSLYCHAFTDSALAVQLITRIYQKELRKAYEKRIFNKKLLDGLTISRVALAKWCLKTKEPLPDFWFLPDDPLRQARIHELDDISLLSQNGALVLFPMSGQNYIAMSSSDGLHTSSSDLESIPSQKKALSEEISRIARQNAQAKYQSAYEIKRRFIRYYYAHNFTKKSHAARDFFCTLSEEEKRELVPSFGLTRDELDAEEEKAIRTLMTALREYTGGKSSPWLEGFTL